MKLPTTATPWLLTCPDDKDKIRLFCLPYAGGGASVYREWAKFLPAQAGIYPIQLPGRETRIAESPLCNMDELVEQIAIGIVPYLQCPFIFFGHSLGARIAFELVRHLRTKWGIQPCHLLVAGSRAPQLAEPNPIHHLPDSEFIKELRRLAGTPEEILHNRDILEIFLPLLRADFTVDETYSYSPAMSLECPIAAFGGTWDLEAQRTEIEAWAEHTSGEFSLEMISGDHFFLHTARELLLQFVSRILYRHMHRDGLSHPGRR